MLSYALQKDHCQAHCKTEFSQLGLGIVGGAKKHKCGKCHRTLCGRCYRGRHWCDFDTVEYQLFPDTGDREQIVLQDRGDAVQEQGFDFQKGVHVYGAQFLKLRSIRPPRCQRCNVRFMSLIEGKDDMHNPEVVLCLPCRTGRVSHDGPGGWRLSEAVLAAQGTDGADILTKAAGRSASGKELNATCSHCAKRYHSSGGKSQLCPECRPPHEKGSCARCEPKQ